MRTHKKIKDKIPNYVDKILTKEDRIKLKREAWLKAKLKFNKAKKEVKNKDDEHVY